MFTSKGILLLYYMYTLIASCMCHRCTPVECLHTVLLGPYKYFTGQLMQRLQAKDKARIIARLRDISYSGLPSKLSPAVCKNYKSFHGRDFKLVAQIALHVFWDHLTEAEKEVWKALSKVNVSNNNIIFYNFFMFAGILFHVLQAKFS